MRVIVRAGVRACAKVCKCVNGRIFNITTRLHPNQHAHTRQQPKLRPEPTTTTGSQQHRTRALKNLKTHAHRSQQQGGNT